MTETDKVIYGFMSESASIGRGEFESLTEEFKETTAKTLSQDILQTIRQKLNGIDVVEIDRSRGDIKNYSELNFLQSALAKLKNLISQPTEDDSVNPLLPKCVDTTILAITNLNKTSAIFKEAYRSKKTLMMLKYQSVLLAIIASVSYLISVSVDFRDPNNLKLKQKITMSEIAPIASLEEFNDHVEKGDFDDMAKGVGLLREFYCEYSPEDMMTICEAVNVIDFINNGVSSLTQSLKGNGRLSALIYKISSVLTLILSLRNSFYAISDCKTKMQDYMNQIKTFVNIDNLPSLSALSRFITTNNKVAQNSEEATKAASDEMHNEDKNILAIAKTTPQALDAITSFIPKPEITGTREVTSLPQEDNTPASPTDYQPISHDATPDPAAANVLSQFGF